MIAKGYRDAFCEKLVEASPCPTETTPDSSKRNPPLAKAEPFSNGGNASGMTDPIREKRYLLCRSNCSQKREKYECVGETALQTPR